MTSLLPSTPASPSTARSFDNPITSPLPGGGRQRSRTFSQAEAEEKRDREEESLRARSGEMELGDGTRGMVQGTGAISPLELRAEVSNRSPWRFRRRWI